MELITCIEVTYRINNKANKERDIKWKGIIVIEEVSNSRAFIKFTDKDVEVF